VRPSVSWLDALVECNTQNHFLRRCCHRLCRPRERTFGRLRQHQLRFGPEGVRRVVCLVPTGPTATPLSRTSVLAGISLEQDPPFFLGVERQHVANERGFSRRFERLPRVSTIVSDPMRFIWTQSKRHIVVVRMRHKSYDIVVDRVDFFPCLSLVSGPSHRQRDRVVNENDLEVSRVITGTITDIIERLLTCVSSK